MTGHDRGGDVEVVVAKGVVKLGISRAQASARKPRPAGIYEILLCDALRHASSDWVMLTQIGQCRCKPQGGWQAGHHPLGLQSAVLAWSAPVFAA